MDKVEGAGGRATVAAIGRASRYPANPPPRTGSHFAEFAVHLLAPGRVMATGALLAAFANHGNTVAGETPEARLSGAEAALQADGRLDYSDEMNGWMFKGPEVA